MYISITLNEGTTPIISYKSTSNIPIIDNLGRKWLLNEPISIEIIRSDILIGYELNYKGLIKNGYETFTKINYNCYSSNLNYKIQKKGTKPHAYLMVFCSSPLTAHSYLNNFKLVVGENIGLTTSIIEKSTLKKTGTPLASVVSPLNFANIKAQLEIEFPNGKSSIIPMHDDGLHADLDKNDGTFGANIVAQDKGIFSLKSVVVGTLGTELTDTYYAEKSFVNDDEPIVHFIRTTQHSVVVVDEHLELVHPNPFLIAKVESSNLHEVVGKKFKAYTEVWARSIKDDSLVPVCWVLGMTTANVNSELGKDFVSLDLQMSLKWLSKANAKFPLTLRNAYIQDVDTSTPIAQLSQSMELETRHVKFDSNGNVDLTHSITFQVMSSDINNDNSNNNNSPIINYNNFCLPPFNKKILNLKGEIECITECQTNDMIYDELQLFCKPVNCKLKYNNLKNYFNFNTLQCEKVVTCNEWKENYDEENNKCKIKDIFNNTILENEEKIKSLQFYSENDFLNNFVNNYFKCGEYGVLDKYKLKCICKFINISELVLRFLILNKD
ncbi:hypothetical protein ABK040_015795 [Willaertia magna]